MRALTRRFRRPPPAGATRTLCPAHALAEAIAAVIEAAKPGAKIVDVCRVGDDYIIK